MRTLAKELRISVITTKHAYEDLERDGFIETVAGKGSFVASKNAEFLREEALKLDELQHENSKLLQTRMKVSQTIMDSIVNLAKNRTKACSTSYGSQGKYSPLDNSKNAIAINRTL